MDKETDILKRKGARKNVEINEKRHIHRQCDGEVVQDKNKGVLKDMNRGNLRLENGIGMRIGIERKR